MTTLEKDPAGAACYFFDPVKTSYLNGPPENALTYPGVVKDVAASQFRDNVFGGIRYMARITFTDGAFFEFVTRAERERDEFAAEFQARRAA